MRKAIAFTSEGTLCAGDLYLPDNPAAGGLPAVVMGHGFSGVKQMLEPYAEHFRAAGFAVLAFDYRFLGMSEGEPPR